jgi:hypothetical protein
MKLALALILIGATTLLPAADKKTKKTPAAAEPQANTIPAAAVADADGVYHYTDKQGKKWLYRKTPFGIQKTEDKLPVAAAPEEDPTTAVEQGDVVKFERPSPFGTKRWEKKKTELAPDEQAVLDRTRQKAAASAKKEQ